MTQISRRAQRTRPQPQIKFMAVGQHGTALPAARTPDRQAQITFPSLGGTNSYVEIIGHFFPATENMLIRFHDCTERNNSESIQIVTPLRALLTKFAD
jgi:hypothetical protein